MMIASIFDRLYFTEHTNKPCFHVHFTVPDIISGDMESAMAVDLNPWVEYEFRVVATNRIGTGDPSIPSRVIRTNEAGNASLMSSFVCT